MDKHQRNSIKISPQHDYPWPFWEISAFRKEFATSALSMSTDISLQKPIRYEGM